MQDLPDVVPLLVCQDIERTHEFLVRAFGFTAGLIERDQDGAVRHGEVHAGGQVIWLHRVWADEGWVSPETSSAATAELVVRVDDVDEHCERARAEGAEIEYGPTTSPMACGSTALGISRAAAGRSSRRWHK